ncbi:MAG: GNAT family N-acetyltransferase [Clostridium sp.]
MNDLCFIKMDENMIEECVDLFIDTFTKDPWNDVYESREQVVNFFKSFISNNYFLGYVVAHDNKIIALSIGMKKPWINGMEYYIDQYCVSSKYQGKGVGSWFLKEIEKDIKLLELNGIILNTEEGYPSFNFYQKNGFKRIDELVVLGK